MIYKYTKKPLQSLTEWHLTLLAGQVNWRHLQLWRLPRSWSQNPWVFISLPKSSFPTLIRENFFISLSFEDKSGYLAFSFWNFSKFPRFENHFHFSVSAAPSNNDTGQPYKDWVFINYTFKRFEGLTQRGPPIKMAKEVVAQAPKWSEGPLLHFWSCKMIKILSSARFARWQQKNFLKQKWENVVTEWSLEIWNKISLKFITWFSHKRRHDLKIMKNAVTAALYCTFGFRTEHNLSRRDRLVLFFKLEQPSR